MRWVWVVLAFLPFPLAAEVVPVRSGEHETFTRLVFTLPSADTEWTLTGQGSSRVLSVTSPNVSFDISGVFERIPRTRLEQVIPVGNSVKLKLACSCETKVFRFGNRSVVVDIMTQDSVAPQLDQHQIEPAIGQFSASTPTLEENEKADILREFSDLDRFIAQQNQQDALARELEEQVNRAASHKLLLPNATPSELQLKPQVTNVEPPVASAPMPVVPNLNLHSANAIDRALEADLTMLERSVSESCIPEKQINPIEWSDSDPDLSQIGTYRRQLVGEFDLLDDTVALNLARLYISTTFGAEALQVLALLPQNDETRALSALARLMDGENQQALEYFSAFQECSAAHKFWAFVAGSNARFTEEEVNRALLLFNKLPAPLREHMAPDFANQLTASGSAAAASQIVIASDREGMPQSAELELSRARISIAQDRPDEASSSLEEIIETNSEITPIALIELIDLHHQRGLAPSGDLIALVSAFSVEHRKTDLGPALRRGNALSRVLDGQYETGFELLQEILQRDGPERQRMVQEELVSLLVKEAPDYDLVKVTVAFGLEEIRNEALQTGLADRMLGAGFVDLAKRHLNRPTQKLGADRQLLKARIALAEQDPGRAQSELLGLDSAPAEELRVQARSMAGEHHEAKSGYRDLNLEQEEELEAWLAGDWEHLATLESSQFSEIALLLLTEEQDTGVESQETAVLQKNKDLLSQSGSLREVTSTLMSSLETSQTPRP